MLFVLNCCFESVHVFKPATSKEGNSEVYVIGLNFHKDLISEVLIDRLISCFNTSQNPMLPLDLIPSDFLCQVIEAAKYFMNLQVSVIESNIRSFRRYDKYEVQRLKRLKMETVKYYMTHYNVRSIEENQKLLQGVTISTDINLNVRVHSGSHAERISFHNLCRNDQIQVLYDRLKNLSELLSSQPHSTKAIALQQNPQNFLNLIRGRPIVKIMSSKFILVTIMKFFIELREFLGDSASFEKSAVIKNGVLTANGLQMTGNYDLYEKSIIELLLTEITSQKSNEFIIKDLLFITQFLIGVLIYLGSFVYKEIFFEIDSGQIRLLNLRNDGIDNIKLLQQSLKSQNIIGICDTKFIFTTHNSELYRSSIDYNNKLCLKYCSSLLSLISNCE